MPDLKPHPASLLFPEMTPDDFGRLRDDIAANGQYMPIVVHEGMILDGRHRYRACQELGRLVRTSTWTPANGESPTDYVIALNAQRRQVTVSQKAKVAVEALPIYEAEAKARQGTRTDLTSRNQLRDVSGDARDLLATKLGVNNAYISFCKKLKLEAPALYERVGTFDGEEEYTVKAAMRDFDGVHNHRAQGTGENEWYTPEQYIEAARTVLGAIDLDPASSAQAQETVQAKVWFGPKKDGLKQAWRGRVWLNPPYSQPEIQHFVEKLVAEVTAERTTAAILLTHAYTDTAWFDAAAQHCAAACFTRGRIRFTSPEGKLASPTQGQCFLYFGDDVEGFAGVFRDFGNIFLPQ